MVKVYAHYVIDDNQERVNYKIVARENALINKISLQLSETMELMKLVVLVSAFIHLVMALSVEGVYTNRKMSSSITEQAMCVVCI